MRVVVLGGGVVGIASAYYLAEDDHEGSRRSRSRPCHGRADRGGDAFLPGRVRDAGDAQLAERVLDGGRVRADHDTDGAR